MFYACIYNNVSARIDRIVGPPMTLDAAIAFLEKHYHAEYRNCDAIPQPVNHSYFKKDQP